MPFQNQILGGVSGQSTGYTIDQSVRYNAPDDPRLTKTLSSGGDRRTFTHSLWFKRSQIGMNNARILSTRTSGSNEFEILINSDGKLRAYQYSGSYTFSLETTARFRDVAGWTHLVIKFDSTPASPGVNDCSMYINGFQITAFDTETYPAQNTDTAANQSGASVCLGDHASTGSYVWEGYFAEWHSIDGLALTPSSFGEVNEDTGQWQPIKYAGAYGTNGFYLKFQDSAALGDDSSGNGNDYASNGLVASDKVIDTPTNNYTTLGATIEEYQSAGGSRGAGQDMSEGGLKTIGNNSSYAGIATSTSMVHTGKWYVEFLCTGQYTYYPVGGVIEAHEHIKAVGYASNGIGYAADGRKFINSSGSTYGATYTNGDIIGMAIDCTNGAVYFSKNNSWQNSGDPTSGGSKTGACGTWAGGTLNMICSFNPYEDVTGYILNFGQDSSFAGTKTAQGNGGDGEDFYYSPPADYVALNANNYPDPTITDPTEHFATTLYTGNGTAIGSGGKTISGLSFQPDVVWFKGRSGGYSHTIFDSIRGATKKLNPDDAGAEGTQTEGLTAFNSDGWTMGNQDNNNTNAATYVAWSWLAAGSNTSNTNGTITTTIRANTTAGFSCGTYAGNSTGGATIGHGLTEVPDFVVIKNRDAGYGWATGPGWPATTIAPNWCYYTAWNIAGTTGYNGGFWDCASPTSTVIKLGAIDDVNGNHNYVFYAWHSVRDYSMMGVYLGNGNADGPFVYTGFRPMYIYVKRMTNPAAESWFMMDAERWYAAGSPTAGGAWLTINNYTAETTNNDKPFDLYSNGFKPRDNSGYFNENNYLHFFMAFAAAPFKYSNAVLDRVPSQA